MESTTLASPITTTVHAVCTLATVWAAASAVHRQADLASALCRTVLLSSPIELEDTAA